MFPVTSKPTPPTVFSLQASDWVHCEEETGAYYQKPTPPPVFNLQASDWVYCEEETVRTTNYLGIPIIFFFSCLFCKNITFI